MSRSASGRYSRYAQDDSSGPFHWTKNPGYKGFEGCLQLAHGEGPGVDSSTIDGVDKYGINKYYLPFMWKHDTERDDGRLDEERRESGRSEEALEEKIATDFINENWDADIERKQKEVALKPRLSQER